MSGDRRRAVDLVAARAVGAVVLAAVALVLFVERVPLALVPLVVGALLVTTGRAARERHALPIAFLLMLPFGIAIVVVAITRA